MIFWVKSSEKGWREIYRRWRRWERRSGARKINRKKSRWLSAFRWHYLRGIRFWRAEQCKQRMRAFISVKKFSALRMYNTFWTCVWRQFSKYVMQKESLIHTKRPPDRRPSVEEPNRNQPSKEVWSWLICTVLFLDQSLKMTFPALVIFIKNCLL